MHIGHEHEHEHCHCEEHAHEHEHCHEHEHEHCCCGNDEGLSKDEKTLKILLAHWVDHNISHEKDFKTWVEKSRELGKNEVADCIEKAIKSIDEANEMLTEARKHI